jgi:hypothetical protein
VKLLLVKMFIDIFFLHTNKIKEKKTRNDHMILSEVAVHIRTNTWYRSGTDQIFQFTVGYGTDPWSGSEMDMRIKIKFT